MGEKGKMTITPPIRSRLAQIIQTVAILLVILLAFVFFAVRTEAARTMIENQIARNLGLKVTIERARIGFPYDLVIEDMVSKNFGEDEQPWFKVAEVRLGMNLRLRTAFRLSIRRAVLSAIHEARDQAQPEFLHRLINLDLTNVADLTRASAGIRELFSVDVSESSIEWFDRRKSPLGVINGIAYRVCPVDIPGHSLYYQSLDVYQATGPAPADLSGSRKEWIVEGDRPAIEIIGASARETAAPPTGEIAVRPIFDPPPGVPAGLEKKNPFGRRNARSAE